MNDVVIIRGTGGKFTSEVITEETVKKNKTSISEMTCKCSKEDVVLAIETLDEHIAVTVLRNRGGKNYYTLYI